MQWVHQPPLFGLALHIAVAVAVFIRHDVAIGRPHQVLSEASEAPESEEERRLWGNICPVHARRATFVLSILSLAPTLSSPWEGPQDVCAFAILTALMLPSVIDGLGALLQGQQPQCRAVYSVGPGWSSTKIGKQTAGLRYA